MARCCGSTGTCACKVTEGRKISVTGTGTSQDPFVVAADIALTVADSTVFDLGLAGDGTLLDPWRLRIGYSSTAHLDDIPDVTASAPTNGQVLTWSNSAQAWTAGPPAVASPGMVSHNNTLSGDGSVGAPLGVQADSTRYITLTTSGVALNDAGINSLVRVFANATARNSASPAPAVNSISLLTDNPGRVDYWDGAEWLPLTNGIGFDVQPGETLPLSGSYTGGRLVEYIAQVNTTTDSVGVFEVIPADDLSGYAGVLAVHLDPIAGTTPWGYLLNTDTDTDHVTATAYRLDNGDEMVSAPVKAVVSARLY